MTGPKKIAIYGSCVSRDALEQLSAGPLPTEYYIARQSMISAFGPPKGIELDMSGYTSPFQKKMVAGDLAGNGPQIIRSVGRQIDLLLWDLIDERGGIYETPAGGRLTATTDLFTSDFLQRWQDVCYHTEFGSGRYLAQWETALDDYYELLVEEGLLERSLYINAPLATHPTQQGRVKRALARDVRKSGEKLQPTFNLMRRMVVERGFPTLDVPEELCRYSPEHIWNPAPFHYCPEFYQFVVREIERRLEWGAEVSCTDDRKSFTLVEPYLLGAGQSLYLQQCVERSCTGVSVNLAISSQSTMPSGAVQLALMFRKNRQVNVGDMHLIEGQGPAKDLPVADGMNEYSFVLKWSDVEYLDSVRLILGDSNAGPTILRFDVDVHS